MGIKKIASKNVVINLALNSFLYFPIFLSVKRYNLEISNRKKYQLNTLGVDHDKVFYFDFDFPQKNKLKIKYASKENKEFLDPVLYDSVFSPVVDRNEYTDENGELKKSYKNTWFCVGDPLRLINLVRGKGKEDIRANFSGTLIKQAAFWILFDKKCEYRDGLDMDDYLLNYNLIGCHPKGMTGYYISDSIFHIKNFFNPVAPCKLPGDEFDYLVKLYKAEQHRSEFADMADPVWLAAVSTELDKMFLFKKKISKTRPLKVQPIFKFFRDQEEKNILMTAIITRNDSTLKDYADVKAAEKILVNGTKLVIDEFAKAVQKHKSGDSTELVALSEEINRFWGRSRIWHNRISSKIIFEILSDEEINLLDIYAENLQAPPNSVQGSTRLINNIISEFLNKNNFHSDDRNKEFEKYMGLLPEKWEIVGSLS